MHLHRKEKLQQPVHLSLRHWKQQPQHHHHHHHRQLPPPSPSLITTPAPWETKEEAKTQTDRGSHAETKKEGEQPSEPTGRRAILPLGRHQRHRPRPPQRGKNIIDRTNEKQRKKKQQSRGEKKKNHRLPPQPSTATTAPPQPAPRATSVARSVPFSCFFSDRSPLFYVNSGECSTVPSPAQPKMSGPGPARTEKIF